MSPRSTAKFIAAWAVALAILAATGPLLGETDRVALAELPAAALGALILAGGLSLLRRRHERPDPPSSSVAAPTLALGITLAGAGAAVGLWLVLLAVPVLAVGAYALMLEGWG
jgi:hypothetical protein